MSGKAPITKADRAWFEAITRAGCIVAEHGGCFGALQRHHRLSGGRRIAHQESLCLCFGHHESGRNDEVIVSRHPWKREFESRYGSEESLMQKTRAMLGAVA